MKKYILPIIAGGILTSGLASAQVIASKGGFQYGDDNKDPYWFKLGGIFKLDQRFFMKDKKGSVHSGANIRSVGLDFNGGLGKDVSYTLGLSYSPKDSKVSVEDAYVTYSGWGKNFSASVGQVNPGFCLENTSSGKWIAFFERSLASTAFGPCPGLGVSINKWDNNYSFTASATQPKMGVEYKDVAGNTLNRSDRWQATARATYSPISEKGKVLQFGLSGHVEDVDKAFVSVSTAPEARSRLETKFLNTVRFQSKLRTTYDLELTGQYNSFLFELEYQKARFKRPNGANSLNFNGYHGHVTYVLTGEMREYKKSNGTFGKVKANSDKGALELGLRHSFINLNDENIQGGAGHTTTAALGWYANSNIKLMTEYGYSTQSKIVANTLQKRHLSTIGLRLIVVFS